MRRTKIICTIGPASESREKIQELLAAGMNVARLNFSHGTHDEHGHRIQILKEEAVKAGKVIAILLDTKGPEIRTGMVPEPGITLIDGNRLILDTTGEIGNSDRVSISYHDLWQEVTPGLPILLDDGQIELEVMEVKVSSIITIVKHGGILKSQKGVNAPGTHVQVPAVTEQDVADIRFGIQQGIDFIAASFTRKAADILAVRRIVEEAGSDVRIIAKIENRQGLEHLDEILEVADGLMVARGDLGVEIPVEEVPLHQKDMINKCNLLGKPVIVATQMLDSMIRQPRPTRAEASDVANAILDGTDAIMLSGETAAGKFPLEAVLMMDRIARTVESGCWTTKSTRHPHLNVAEAISYASYTIASDLEASAIITPTHSGRTARMIAKYRPKAIIIAATPFVNTAKWLTLQWGVHPIVIPEGNGTDELLSISVNSALTNNLVKTGDVVVITAGVPVGKVGTTNMIKVQIIGNVLAKGSGIGRKSYAGSARIVRNLNDSFQTGDILIATATNAEFVTLISRAGALIIEEGGLTSHAAIAALNYGIPAIVGADCITSKVTNGQTLTVDTMAGVVYDGAVTIL